MGSLVGRSLRMNVKQSAQGASGGSYLVRYSAEITLTAQADVHVTVAEVYPNDPEQSDVDAARNAIQEGCRKTLQPLNLGALVTVHELTIHPVDFVPDKFAVWTAHDLKRKLDSIHGDDL